MRYILTTLLVFSCVFNFFIPGASAERDFSERPTIVGSWEEIDDGAEEVFFATFHGGPRRGTFNYTNPNATISLSHGSWERIDQRRYNATDVGYIYDGSNGKAVFRYKYKTKIVLSQDGKTAQFTFQFEKSALDGTVVETSKGKGKGVRIEVEPLD